MSWGPLEVFEGASWLGIAERGNLGPDNMDTINQPKPGVHHFVFSGFIAVKLGLNHPYWSRAPILVQDMLLIWI